MSLFIFVNIFCSQKFSIIIIEIYIVPIIKFAYYIIIIFCIILNICIISFILYWYDNVAFIVNSPPITFMFNYKEIF